MAKHRASEVSPSSRPASGGPMKRLALKSIALRARALGRSSGRPTKLLISDWRRGVSKLLSTPRTRDMPMISPVPMRSVQVRAASAKACSARSACTPISHFFLSWRSIHAPASGPTTSCGMSAQKAVTPSSADEPVSR